MTTDLSRAIFDPRKRYESVLMQQGRVTLDSDWNEAAEIAAEATRRALLDIVGPHGTQDDGFRISDPVVDAASGTIDFTIGAGSYYLGGLRGELFEDLTYRLQTDWLQLVPEPAPGAPRFDLVYLEAWLQGVGAVEDEELREVALGGPDTTTRLRTMLRFGVEPDVGSPDCADGWTTAATRWTAAGEGTITPMFELATGVTLSVDYAFEEEPDDLCSPSVMAGYLGAENQSIRVQLVDEDHFTWGFDNASPLYRVSLGGDRETLELLNLPPDQAHWPLAGDVVELLPWSAVLPNGEKVAEVNGHLTTVAESFNPDRAELVLTDAAPAGFGEEWEGRDDAALLGDAFSYLRVWQRGPDHEQDAAIPCPPGVPVVLGTTGIEVTISSGARRPGDYWVIAARPESPDQVTPWSLEDGRPAHGLRRFRAPLAVIGWSAGGATGEVVSDCRRPFHPLTEPRDCVTYTVGDGTHSHGDFMEIQDAIDALPPDGGEVRVLPGEYHQRFEIVNRHNVHVAGCGLRTQITWGREEALCVIRGSQLVHLSGLMLHAPDVRAIEIGDVAGPPGRGLANVGGNLLLHALDVGLTEAGAEAREKQKAPTFGVTLSDLIVRVRDQSAVFTRNVLDLQIRDSHVVVEPLEEDLDDSERGRWPALFLGADRLRLERNVIAASGARGARRTAWGGVQVAGGSDQVRIHANQIQGGTGHGITLGSVAYVPPMDFKDFLANYAAIIAEAIYFPTGWTISVDDDGCIRWDPYPTDPGSDDGNRLMPVSEGALSDVDIEDNTIRHMGGSGISVARFFNLLEAPDCIGVQRLRIRDNLIGDCMQGEVREAPPELRDLVAFGGIALAGATQLEIRENRIEGNGRSHIDPLCGIFALHVENGVIADNRIRDNGPRTDTDQTPRPGQRGGVVVTLAVPALGAIDPETNRPGRIGPALEILDNEIVQPEGRALRIMAQGQVEVSRNYLATQGFTVRQRNGLLESLVAIRQIHTTQFLQEPGLLPAATDLLGGACVALTNLGQSPDLGLVQEKAIKAGDNVGAVITAAAKNGASTGGTIALHDNEIVTDLPDGADAPPTAVLVLTLDDATVQANRSTVQGAAMIANAFVYGATVRVADNRFIEPLVVPGTAFTAFAYSAVTVGAMNATTGNQGTHCFAITGPVPQLVVDADNRSLLAFASEDFCQAFSKLPDITVGAIAKQTTQQVLSLIQ